MPVQFKYRLTGAGWSEGSISDGHASATLTASYLEDALGDLLEAVGVLLEGAIDARCSWEEEPGEYRWIFSRQGNDVRLQVLGFEDMYSLKPDPAGYSIFETSLSLRDLAIAIADGAQAVLDEHGEDGYLAKWDQHPFPSEHLALIRARLTINVDSDNGATG